MPPLKATASAQSWKTWLSMGAVGTPFFSTVMQCTARAARQVVQ